MKSYADYNFKRPWSLVPGPTRGWGGERPRSAQSPLPGRYVSCGHAGGLSCLLIDLSEESKMEAPSLFSRRNTCNCNYNTLSGQQK